MSFIASGDVSDYTTDLKAAMATTLLEHFSEGVTPNGALRVTIAIEPASVRVRVHVSGGSEPAAAVQARMEAVATPAKLTELLSSVATPMDIVVSSIEELPRPVLSVVDASGTVVDVNATAVVTVEGDKADFLLIAVASSSSLLVAFISILVYCFARRRCRRTKLAGTKEVGVSQVKRVGDINIAHGRTTPMGTAMQQIHTSLHKDSPKSSRLAVRQRPGVMGSMECSSPINPSITESPSTVGPFSEVNPPSVASPSVGSPSVVSPSIVSPGCELGASIEPVSAYLQREMATTAEGAEFPECSSEPSPRTLYFNTEATRSTQSQHSVGDVPAPSTSQPRISRKNEEGGLVSLYV